MIRLLSQWSSEIDWKELARWFHQSEANCIPFLLLPNHAHNLGLMIRLNTVFHSDWYNRLLQYEQESTQNDHQARVRFYDFGYLDNHMETCSKHQILLKTMLDWVLGSSRLGQQVNCCRDRSYDRKSPLLQLWNNHRAWPERSMLES